MMMTMINRKILVVMSFLLLSISAIGQEKDFGLWYEAAAEHKFSKKLEMDVSADVRTYKNASKIEEAFLEAGLTWYLNKHLSMAGSYRLTDNIEKDNSYYFQHKYFIDVKENGSLGRLNLSARFRLQIRTKTYLKDESEDHPDYTGRIKLKAVYKTPSFPLDPYIYAETFLPMFSKNSGSVGKNRFSAGAELNITRKHSVSMEYIFQRDYLPHMSDMNIISLSYNLKF